MTLLSNEFMRKIKAKTLPEGLQIVESHEELARIETFREASFSPDFPDLKNYRNDPHDPYSLIMYTENEKREVTSTGRLVFDSPVGLPADEYAHQDVNLLRNKNLKLTEASRLTIPNKDKGLIRLYYKSFYCLSVENGFNSIVVVINKSHLNFYINRLGGRLLVDNLENMNGSGLKFVCAEWPLEKTSDKFYRWVGLEKNTQVEAPYSISTWNSYSRCFASIYTDYQRKVYQKSVEYLSGSVLDLGCGPARIAPLLADKFDVTKYTGVEYSGEMYELAKFTLNKVGKPSFKVIHQKAEQVEGVFTSAVSLLSYYAFSDPKETLRHIFKCLQPGGCFVIANPNEKLDQIKIQRQVEKEMMWHPDYELFKKYNFELADNSKANFSPMNQLIKELQSVGFLIESCHQEYYEGGLNFVVCSKPI